MTDKHDMAALVANLVWDEPCTANNHTHIARSAFGEYYVHVDGGRHQAWLEANISPYERKIGEAGSLHDAKASADSDYRANVATLINPAAVEALMRGAERRGMQRAMDECGDLSSGRECRHAILALITKEAE